MSSLVLGLSNELLAFNYRDTFVNAFEVRSAFVIAFKFRGTFVNAVEVRRACVTDPLLN
jgi:hypothetical protein